MARSFNGSTDIASAPGTGTPDDVTTSAMTFCCWFKLLSSPSGEAPFFAKWGAGNNGGYMLNYNQPGFANEFSGQIYISIPENHFQYVFSGPTLNTNQWYVGVAAYENNLSFRVWLGTNGVMTLLGTDGSVGSVGSMVSSGTNLIFGGANAGRSGSVAFHGVLGPSAVWNVKLSDGEINSLVSVNPNAVRVTSLVGYWPFYGASGGSIEPDLSGNKQNAALTGTAQANHPPCVH